MEICQVLLLEKKTRVKWQLLLLAASASARTRYPTLLSQQNEQLKRKRRKSDGVDVKYI
jgi:hypothetical protein